jgi:hypothetical protein
MEPPVNLIRRDLLVKGGIICTFPSSAIAKSKPLILGLVTGSSLYPMAVQRTSKGLDWTNALDNEKLTESRLVDTIFGMKPPPLLHAYNLQGLSLNRTIKTNWTRFGNPGEAGDQDLRLWQVARYQNPTLCRTKLLPLSLPPCTQS